MASKAKRTRTAITVLNHPSLKKADSDGKMQQVGAIPHVHCTFDFTALWAKVFSSNEERQRDGQVAFENLAMRDLCLAINKLGTGDKPPADKYTAFMDSLPTGQHLVRQGDKSPTDTPEIRVAVGTDATESVRDVFETATGWRFEPTSRAISSGEKAKRNIDSTDDVAELAELIAHAQARLAQVSA